MSRRLMLRNASGGGGGLPSEYQQVEWVGSTGTQYINTGIIPNDEFGMKLIATNTAPQIVSLDYMFLGIRQNNKRWFLAQSYNSWYYGWNNYHYVAINDSVQNVFSTISLNYKNDRKYIVEGGRTVNLTESLYSNFTASAFVFAANDGNNNAIYQAKCKIQFAEITNGNNVIANYVPCYRKSDGEIGMYDTVSATFFTNAGTGTFTKGADVI